LMQSPSTREFRMMAPTSQVGSDVPLTQGWDKYKAEGFIEPRFYRKAKRSRTDSSCFNVLIPSN
jgi:hypothetical protein